MSEVSLTVVGYTIPLIVCYYLWVKETQKVKVFQAVWVFALMFMLNAYGLVYASLFSKDVLPLGVSLRKYIHGANINLAFIIVWGIGYWIGVRKEIVLYSKKSAKKRVKYVGVMAARVLLVLSSIATLFFYSMGISYGETVFDYSSLPLYFGTVASFKNLFLPTAAAYLMIIDKVQKKDYRIRSIPVEKILWFAIGVRVVIGLTLDMQRGDVVYPILVVLIILTAKGYVKSRKKILISILSASMALMVVSPLLDILRQPAVYDKNITVENVVSAVDKVAETNKGGLISWSTVMYVPYSKAILPSSSYALSHEVSESGYIYLRLYDDPIIDMVPRFIWPDKPWPLSVNGEYSGMAAGVAAKNLGKSNIIWVIGGGTMYWQFGWIGVIVGGLLVGLTWGQITEKMLLSKSPFLLIFVFSMFSWGLHYVESPDQLILSALRQLRALLIVWIPIQILIRVATNIKKR